MRSTSPPSLGLSPETSLVSEVGAGGLPPAFRPPGSAASPIHSCGHRQQAPGQVLAAGWGQVTEGTSLPLPGLPSPCPSLIRAFCSQRVEPAAAGERDIERGSEAASGPAVSGEANTLSRQGPPHGRPRAHGAESRAQNRGGGGPSSAAADTRDPPEDTGICEKPARPHEPLVVEPRQRPERALSWSPQCPRRAGLAPRRVPWPF